MDGQGFESVEGEEILLFPKVPGHDSQPNQPPLEWVKGMCVPWVKRTDRDTDHSHLAPRLSMSGVIPLLSLYAFAACTGTTLIFFTFK